MTTLYGLQDHVGLIPLDKKPSASTSESPDASLATVEVFTQEDLAHLDIGDDDVEQALVLLSHSHGSFADILPHYLIGSLSFPNKKDLLSPSFHFGFCLNERHLILIDLDNICKNTLEGFTGLAALPSLSTARVLFELMKHYLIDDTVFLSNKEKYLGELEEKIVEHHDNVSNQELLTIRRELLKLDRLYQQLADISILMGKDECHLLAKSDRRLFRLLSQEINRLFLRAQYLKEYSLQLRELYQTQIDLQQNKTIQWLTVITTLVVPLTLITSWYGMNFTNMPELSLPYSYPVVILICVALILLQLYFFRKRRWL